MYYSDEIVDEVRSRNDIVDVIGSYISLKHKGNSYSACCPFHHEKTPSFHVSRDKQMYHCFGCGVGGNVYTFVMEYENFSFVEAVKYLADRAGITLPEQKLSDAERQKENAKVRLKEMNKQAAAYFHYLLTKTEHGKKAREYLAGRGISEETINRFALGYSDIYENDLYKYLKSKGYTDSDMKDSGLVNISESKGATDIFWNRVMVPILDINGKVIAFGGRVLGDGLPKYINTKETKVFDKSHNLFAMNLARRSKRRGIIICEGYMDAISLHEAGFDNAVASLGTAFTMGQASIIKRYTDEVYLAYDSDGAGTNATLKAIGILRDAGITSRVIDMKPHKDPDEFIRALGKDAYEDRIKSAVTGIMFEINTISGRYNLQDPDEKTRFVRDAAKRISSLDDAVSRHSYIDAVAESYDIDKDSFKQLVTQYGTLAVKENQAKEGYNEDKAFTEGTVTNKKDNSGNAPDNNKPHRLLLTWMVNNTKLFEILDGIIDEDDFMEEDYHAVASILYRQYRENGCVMPAAIVDRFDDIDKQKLVAAMLQTELPFDTTSDELERAVNDVVKRVKLSHIDYELTQCGSDMAKFQKLIMEKAKIDRLHISLDGLR